MLPLTVRSPTLEPLMRTPLGLLVEIAPVVVTERLPPLQLMQPVLELMVVSEMTGVHAMVGTVLSVGARIDAPVINL